MAEKKYVIFKLDNGEYGLDINAVQEIIELKEITKIPQAADLIMGIINLRGKIIPIVDLKKKFYGQPTGIGVNSQAVIVDMAEQAVGIIADDVSEVLSIADELVENTQGFLKQSVNPGVTGMGKLKDRLLIFLDIGQVFSSAERARLLAVNEEA